MAQVLVKAVDFELLKTIQSQPMQQTDAGLELLENRADALRRDIERGNERYLKAPSDLLAGLEEKLLGWKKELTAIEGRIRLAQIATNPSGAESFSEWWNRVRGQLAVVSEIQWGNQRTDRCPIILHGRDRAAVQKHIGAEFGSCRASWTGNPDAGFEIVLGKGNIIELDSDGKAWELVEVEFPVKPAVMAERDSLSALLHDLKVRITLFWKPRNSRHFELDRRRLQAEINENVLAARTATRGRGMKRWA